MHKKHQCLKCHFHKTCDGIPFQVLNQRECEAMEIGEYTRLIESQKNTLQRKVDTTIKQATDLIKSQQSCLLKHIESNPNNEWQFELEAIEIRNTLEDNQKPLQQPRIEREFTEREFTELNRQYQARRDPYSNFNVRIYHSSSPNSSSHLSKADKNTKMAEYQLKLKITTTKNAKK